MTNVTIATYPLEGNKLTVIKGIIADVERTFKFLNIGNTNNVFRFYYDDHVHSGNLLYQYMSDNASNENVYDIIRAFIVDKQRPLYDLRHELIEQRDAPIPPVDYFIEGDGLDYVVNEIHKLTHDIHLLDTVLILLHFAKNKEITP